MACLPVGKCSYAQSCKDCSVAELEHKAKCLIVCGFSLTCPRNLSAPDREASLRWPDRTAATCPNLPDCRRVFESDYLRRGQDPALDRNRTRGASSGMAGALHGARAVGGGCRAAGADEVRAEDESRTNCLRAKQADGGTGIRHHQVGDGIPPVPVAWLGEWLAVGRFSERAAGSECTADPVTLIPRAAGRIRTGAASSGGICAGARHPCPAVLRGATGSCCLRGRQVSPPWQAGWLRRAR